MGARGKDGETAEDVQMCLHIRLRHADPFLVRARDYPVVSLL